MLRGESAEEFGYRIGHRLGALAGKVVPMTTIMEEDQLMEVGRICISRLPIEACGVVLPTPHRGKQIFELPNRSMKADVEYKVKSSDMILCIGDWLEKNTDKWPEMVFWHTHPSGNAEPSQLDLKNRLEGCRNVIIAINDGNLIAVEY